MQGWKVETEAELTTENLARLFANEISTIRIRGFARPEECRAVAQAMSASHISGGHSARRVRFSKIPSTASLLP